MLNKMFSFAVAFFVLVPSLYAADLESETETEATIDVVAEVDAGPESLSEAIELPEYAADQAAEAAAFGLATANAARSQGQAFGEERAREARESGAPNSAFDARSETAVGFREESPRPAPAGQL